MIRKERLPNGVEIEIDDETGLCRHVRVPVTLMDGRPPAPAAGSYAAYCADHAARLRDYARQGAQLSRHAPGVVPLTDTGRRAREAVIASRNAALSDAWRSPASDAPARTNDANAALAERDRVLANAWRQQ
jgi:hypothetical protein